MVSHGNHLKFYGFAWFQPNIKAISEVLTEYCFKFSYMFETQMLSKTQAMLNTLVLDTIELDSVETHMINTYEMKPHKEFAQSLCETKPLNFAQIYSIFSHPPYSHHQNSLLCLYQNVDFGVYISAEAKICTLIFQYGVVSAYQNIS